MAHYQQRAFMNKVKRKLPEFFKNKNVLDVGSLDINGSNKTLFTECSYIGLDVGEGKNVDVVCPAHEYDAEDESFDVVISSECFEHDMHYPKTFKNIVRMLKSGGLFLFTCATTGREEHGTRRASPQDAPLLQGEWQDYYKNLTEADVREVIDIDQIFSSAKFEIGYTTKDLYFYGIKK